MYRIVWTLIAATALFGAGCLQEEIESRSQAVTAEGAVGLLALLNDQQNTTFERLDIDCAIRSDSAKQIIRHRDGHDKTPLTADDDLFESVDELEGVSMVGPWTIDRLTQCAWLFGYMKGVGPTLSGIGTAAVNGTMSPGEWDNAATLGIDVELPEGGSVPATLHVMNDDARLYMAISIDDDLSDRMFRFTVLFDHDSDGFVESGEDRIAAVWYPSSGITQFGDAHIFAPATRAGYFIASIYYDTSAGGTSEGGAATGSATGSTVLEMWHPLDSADDAHDLSLAAGNGAGFSFAVAVLGNEWIETRSWASLVVAP